MAIFDFFSLRERAQDLAYFEDLDLIDVTDRSYLKRMALDTNINFIARSLAQSKFIVKGKGDKEQDLLNYKLNVRPNTDQTATKFWQEVVYRLIYDGEVLIVKTDTGDLMIASDFQRNEYALFDDTFYDVVVKDFTYERTFQMSDVIYLDYHNSKISKFVDGLFADYGQMFGRMIDNHLINNQIRGTVSMEMKGNAYTPQQIERLNKFVTNLTQGFKNNLVAIIPTVKGIEYTDLKSAGTKQDLKEINELQEHAVSKVSEMLGIPPVLLSGNGDASELESAMKIYNKYCLGYFIKLITDECNAKFFTQDESIKGYQIKVIGINKKDPLELSTAVDKLRASGTFTGNQIREMLGEEPVDDPKLDEYVITKNYQSVATDTLKGGENSAEETK